MSTNNKSSEMQVYFYLGLNPGSTFLFNSMYKNDRYHKLDRREDVNGFFSEICSKVQLSKGHSLVISIPPRYLISDYFSNFSDYVLYSRVPACCFVSRHVMLAHYHNTPNCIVIEKDVGDMNCGVNVTISVVSNNQSLAEQIHSFSAPKLETISTECIDLLPSIITNETSTHLIVVNLEKDFLISIQKILSNLTIIESCDAKEAFFGCQIFASREDFRSFSSFHNPWKTNQSNP